MAPVLESFDRLKRTVDLVIVEGAGSPAEVNLRPRDIANMGFARAANVPVVLAGDIDRGGVIAQIVGTQVVIDPDDAAMIAGFVINKFRGDPRYSTMAMLSSPSAPNGAALACCRSFPTRRGFRPRTRSICHAVAEAAAFASPRCNSPVSPISTISIRCRRSLMSVSPWCVRARRSQAIPIW